MTWVDKFFDGPYWGELRDIDLDDERTIDEVKFITSELNLGSTDRVLDLACGHGRHAILVAKHVGKVVGYDRTERFIEFAKKWADEVGVSNVEFIVGDMRELDFDAEFDAVYNYFTAWGYYDDDANFDVLKRVYRALKPGGHFLLEFIGRDWLVRNFNPRGWNKTSEDTILLEERSFDFETGRSHSKRTYITPTDRKVIDIDLRVPTTDEFMRLFKSAGFIENRVVQAPDGGDVTFDSHRIAVSGEKG